VPKVCPILRKIEKQGFLGCFSGSPTFTLLRGCAQSVPRQRAKDKRPIPSPGSQNSPRGLRIIPPRDTSGTRVTKLRDEFRDATLDFVAGYSPLRESALVEWREAARHMNGSAEHLIATIEQSFPPAGDIARRFAFETRLFQIAAPDSIRLEVVEGMAEIEVADDRRRIAEDASRRLQNDLDGFIRESVATMREETAKLASEVLATIDGSENGVHQRTLNRLAGFIDSFRSLNFAGDQQLENTLERFRRDLLTRSAEDYRNDSGAMA